MKKIMKMMTHTKFRLFEFWALILVLALVGEEALALVEEEKRIEKTYTVSENTQIEIANKFGTVHIDTWDKNQVSLEVVILVDNRSESAAQQLLDDISVDIDDENPTRYLGFRTQIRRGNVSDNGGERFEINYNLSIPRRNNLTIDNKHGDIYLGSIDGEVTIYLAHGRIKTEELNGKSRIDLAFSGGGMKSLIKGQLKLQHTSRLEIDHIGNVELDIQHTQMSIEEAELLDIVGQHSHIEIGRVHSLEGDLQHSELEIDELEKLVALQLQHSDLDINKVQKDFDRIDLDGGFSDFNINLDPESSGSIDAQMQFGDLSYRGGVFDFDNISKKQNLSEYRGSFGPKPGSASKILIRTQYGDAKIVVDD